MKNGIYLNVKLIITLKTITVNQIPAMILVLLVMKFPLMLMIKNV